MEKETKKKYKPGAVLISASEIKKRVNEIAQAINEDFEGENAVFLIVLKGSFIFAADLLRKVRIESLVDFIKVKSYGSSTKSGKLEWDFSFSDKIEGRNVVLIDDIFDSGKTIHNLKKYIKKFKPKSVKLCVLLKKDIKRKKVYEADLDYVGFRVPSVFVVGYGLDYAGKYRNLPYIAELTEENDFRK